MPQLPTADKEIQLSSGPIRYRDVGGGGGDPLVFVHGLLVNGLLWHELVPELEGSHRCIVPDWPLGSHHAPMDEDADLSPPAIAALVDELLGALGIDSATIVGNDSGGAVSQIVATEHPQRVGRLVLTNCDAYDNFLPLAFRYLKLTARIPGGMTALAQSMRLKPTRRLPIAFGALSKRRLPGELLEAWVRPTLDSGEVRRDAGKFLRGSSSKQTERAAELLSGFRAPALLAWGHEDRFFPVEHAERLAETIPDAHLELIDEAATFVSLDQPKRLAELIDEFVRDTEPAPAAA